MAQLAAAFFSVYQQNNLSNILAKPFPFFFMTSTKTGFYELPV